MRPTAGNAFLQQQGAHPGDALRNFLVGAVQLTQQDRRGTERIAGMDVVLGGADRRVIHHLEPAGDDSGGDDRGHGLAGLLDVVECGQYDLCTLRFRQQLDRDLDDNAKQALRTGEQRQQVVPRRVERLAAERDEFAVNGQELDAQHIVYGEAVFQAMHAAGVFGHVAADRAGNLRRRIGGVIEAMRGRGLADGEVAHTRLDDGGAVERVNLEDAVEFRERQQHAVGQRQGAARQSGSGAARHDRNPMFVTQLQNGLDLFKGFGQRHEAGQGAVGGKPIAFVGTAIFFGHQQRRGRKQLA